MSSQKNLTSLPPVGYIDRTIAASYTCGGQTITAGPSAVINFATKIYDTHNAVTVGAGWVFRAPASGIYSVKARILWEAWDGWNPGHYAGLATVGGLGGGYLDFWNGISTGGAGVYRGLQGTRDIKLLTGETLAVAVFHSATKPGGLAIQNDLGHNYIQIKLERWV